MGFVISRQLDNTFNSAVLYRPDSAPPYNPRPWNKHRRLFNCYSYALRIYRRGWVIPGSLNLPGNLPIDPADVAPEPIENLLIADGLVRIREHDCSRDNHIIAVFISVSEHDPDVHVLSFDNDGTWSHKRGHAFVQKYDFDGNVITDTRHASLGTYKIFAGFYRVPPEGISYYSLFEEMDDFNPIACSPLLTSAKEPHNSLAKGMT